jgi:hypothetical protein
MRPMSEAPETHVSRLPRPLVSEASETVESEAHSRNQDPTLFLGFGKRLCSQAQIENLNKIAKNKGKHLLKFAILLMIECFYRKIIMKLCKEKNIYKLSTYPPEEQQGVLYSRSSLGIPRCLPSFSAFLSSLGLGAGGW